MDFPFKPVLSAVLALAFSVAGCGEKAARERLQDRVVSVEAQLGSIQAQLDQIQAMTDENRSSIFILEDKLDTQRQYIQTIKTNQEIKILRVTPEMMAAASDLPEAPSKPAPAKESKDEERKPSVAATPPPPLPPSPSAARSKPAPETRVASVEPAKKSDYRNPLDLYGAAYKLFEAGRYDEGLDLFREFVRRWPNHDYADNSQYWIGECYYSRSDYEQAIQEFGKVLDKYPAGNKAPDALLKVGFSQKKLGRDREANSTLQRLLNKYPYSDAAPKAGMKLGDWAQGRD